MNRFIAFFRAVISIFCVIAILSNERPMSAGTENPEFQEIITLYKQNSPDYQKILLEQKLNTTKYQIYKDNLKQYEGRIGTLDDKTLLAYQENLLNANIYEFYYNDFMKITEENQNKQIYAFISELYKIPVYKANISYHQRLLKLLNEELNIEKAKLKRGYTTKAVVQSKKKEVELEKANIDLVKKELEELESQINFHIGNSKEYDFSLGKVIDLKKKEEYQEAYLSGTQVAYYNHMEKAYKIYKENISSLSDSSNYLETAENQLNLIDMERKRYINQVESTILKHIRNFQDISKQIIVKEAEIEALNLQIKSNKILLKKGKIQKNTLTKLYAEKEKLKFEKMQLLYSQNIVFYGLENMIMD